MFPNPPAPALSAMDEAKLFMQNRQLLAQLQANPGLAFGQTGAKPTQGMQAPSAAFLKPGNMNLGQYMKVQDAGLQNGVPNYVGQMQQQGFNAVQQPPRNMLQQNGNQGGNQQSVANHTALMQAMIQNQQFMNNGVNNGNLQNNPAYMQNNNNIAAAAAAAATAANLQARAAQAREARAHVANLQQQFLQEQQQAAAAAQRQNLANAQQNAAAVAQNATWLNAAVQRAVANGQLVIQNGKPVLVQNALQQPLQQQQPQQHNQNAAQMMQQLQAAQQAAAAAQKQAQHVQMVKQIQAALAQEAKIGANQNQVNQNAMAILKQVQLQDALAAVNGRAVPGHNAPQQNGNGFTNGVQLGNGFANLNHQQHAQQQAHAQVQAQQAQAQAQQRIRHNMAALANLTPGQLQALSANPALAQALLQARAAAGAAPPPQSGAAMTQAAAVNIPGADAAINGLRPADQQHLRQQLNGMVHEISPTSSRSGSVSGSPPNAMSKEQRRMALACVALQLAHSGISVDQAIHSGIMGGMSVTDVRFIVEVYNAEQARMKEQPGMTQAGDANAAAVGRPNAPALPLDMVKQASRAGSPAHSSYAGSEHAGRSKAGSVAGGMAPDIAADMSLFDADAFNAFSYGFFGATNAQPDLLKELETGLEDISLEQGVEKEGEELGELPAWLTEGNGLSDWRPDAEEADAKVKAEVGKQDDVAARLANLDLGSGFF